MEADSQNMVMIENKALRNVPWIEVILWVGEGENAKGGATFSTMGFDAPQKFVKTLDKQALLTKYDATAVSLNCHHSLNVRYITIINKIRLMHLNY